MSKKAAQNEPQIAAIKHAAGPLLVVAGAGTGKTRVITERIKYLILEKGVDPDKILALTFTEKAANEMVERIGDVMPLGYKEPWVCTFHTFADRILKSEGLDIGLDPSYRIIPDADQWILLRKNIFKMALEYYRPMGNPTKFIGAILKFVSRLQDEFVSAKEFKEFVTNNVFEEELEKKKYLELAYVYKEYNKLKTERSRMDFGDLISTLLVLFNTRPNILNKYKKQFSHILVDEFQDTNFAQYELVKKLLPPSKDYGDRSLAVVGDDSQSIYKFRGAAVSNILQFMDDYKDAQMLTLTRNYRSTQTILDASYKLIQNNNPDTLESKLNISKKLVSDVSPKGLVPVILQAETLEDEVELVVSKIQEILEKEPEIQYQDIAILARANNHLDPFVMALRRHGLPYQLVGNRGLYDRDEVRDVVALINVVTNPMDNMSLYRVLNIRSLEISQEEISGILADARYKRIDLWDLVKLSKNEAVLKLQTQIEDFQKKIAKATPSEFIFDIVSSIDYVKQFSEADSVESQLSIKNLDLFLSRAKKFEIDFYGENRQIPTVLDFMDYLDLASEAGENPAQAEIEDIETINLMTVHASKGLEFSAVFMVNLVSDRFPTRNKKDVIPVPDALIKESLPSGDEHIQEERRLFYVGMTRAKKYLYMTLARDYGGKRDKIPSGYLTETGLKIQEALVSKEKSSKQDALFGEATEYRKLLGADGDKYIPQNLTYTKLEDFLTCPLKFRYKHILNIPTPPSPALSFGNSIHYSLRDFHQKIMAGVPTDLDDLLASYEANWQPFGYKDKEHQAARFDSGKKLLTRYYSENEGKKFKHVGIEKNFRTAISGVVFTGRIDRIDLLPDGSVEIIDYKTGTPKDQKEIDNDMQVGIYAIAAKEDRGLGFEPKLLSLYFLEDSGSKMSTTRTPEQLAEIKTKIGETVEKMKTGDFTATPGFHCQWCDFNNICPFAYKG